MNLDDPPRPLCRGQHCDECLAYPDGPLLYIGSNRPMGGVFICERCARKGIEFFERCALDVTDGE
jgi:hypothetical protein